jgi:glycosyltransferase involved in cell wall biosynthesis
MEARLNIIVSTSHRDWVLGILADKLAAGIRSAIPKIVEFPQSRRNTRNLRGSLYLPNAAHNVFLHQDLALTAFQKGWLNKQTQNILYVTHLTGDIKRYRILQPFFKFVLHNNSRTYTDFIEIGFPPELMGVTPNPIDIVFSTRFSDKRTSDVVFVANYTQRKRPDLLIGVVKRLRGINFTLIGRGWIGTQEYDELMPLNNFAFAEFDFESYPALLAQHKVFCTLSDLEGGPVPLLESLVAGLSVVATDTGTARDLIPPSCRKFILPINPTVEMISQAILGAIEVDIPGFESKKEYFYDGFVDFIDSKLIE